MKPKKVHGVGINDSDVRDSFYWTWVAMLDRCYNPKVKPRNVTYAGCTVAPEWLTFSNFKAWMLRQPWQGREKAKIIREIAEQQVDWWVGAALLARADQLDNDHLRGVETIKL